MAFFGISDTVPGWHFVPTSPPLSLLQPPHMLQFVTHLMMVTGPLSGHLFFSSLQFLNKPSQQLLCAIAQSCEQGTAGLTSHLGLPSPRALPSDSSAVSSQTFPCRNTHIIHDHRGHPNPHHQSPPSVCKHLLLVHAHPVRPRCCSLGCSTVCKTCRGPSCHQKWCGKFPHQQPQMVPSIQ